MDWTVGTRWLAALTSRQKRRVDPDPADMGTAFGLDAITTLEPQASNEAGALEAPPGRSRFERRVHRRSRR
ncbi:MAG: hypothetical protein ABI641_03185 [Caldimonas sp.]